MKKTKPDALLTSDWHIRGDKPLCRVDNYMEAQEKKIRFIQNLAFSYDIPVLVAGDFGHRAIWGDKLIKWTQDILFEENAARLRIIPGQHDLIDHRLANWDAAALGVLDSAKYLNVMTDFHRFPYNQHIIVHNFPYGEKITKCNPEPSEKAIAMVHQMVIKSQKDKLWGEQKACDATRLLKRFPCYNLIVSGDNHQSFSVEYEGRLLVNPGSMMRSTAKQIDFKPRVALWYAETNSIEWVYLPIEDGVIDRSHIDKVEERDNRIEAFVEHLDEDVELGLCYSENLEKAMNNDIVTQPVKEKVYATL